MMSELFPLLEAEPKPMPRKSDPETRDSKKAKTKNPDAESSSKSSVPNTSEITTAGDFTAGEIQKALETLDEIRRKD